MNKLIEDLIKKGMGNFMDRSRDALAWTDEIYLNDIKDENELSRRYENFDLTKGLRKVINDYMACATTVNHRYADISYMCGFKDAVSMLVSLWLIKALKLKNDKNHASKYHIHKYGFRASRKTGSFCCPKTSRKERGSHEWQVIQFCTMKSMNFHAA